MQPERLDAVFAALADPTRRAILARLTEGDLPVLLPRMEIDFHGVRQNHCEVRWRMLSRSENVLIRYTVLPLARWLMGRRAKAGLRTLKRRLEDSAPATGACEATRRV